MVTRLCWVADKSSAMSKQAKDTSFFSAWIGRKVKYHRDRLEWSQEFLAERMGVSRSSIANIETGRQLATIDLIYLFAAEFSCEIHDLIPTKDELIKSIIQK